MASIPRLPEGTSLQVGTHRVTIVSYLSEGGYAHIYSVHMDPLEGEDELACLKRVIIPDKNGLYQLRKEVEVMKILRGAKSIVQYYDSHAERQNDGTYQVLLLMELCPNKSLLDFMNARLATKLTESEILKILLDVSLGVYEMHRKNLIHRDIKIENVLIDAKGRFKLCDFGSTTSPIMPPSDVQGFQWLANDLLFQTTPQYRAPEMIDLYKGFAIDERADIWALGCFLYKLCYFTTPFEASGDISILHGAFQYLPSPQFSNDLKNLVLIMLQENPFYRPNIAQVIMLVSKIVGLDFGSLNIPEISRTGPYDFQGLYDYQRQKQEEMAGQQQLYLQCKNFYIAHASPDTQVYSSVNPGNKLTTSSVPSVESNSITPSGEPKPQGPPDQNLELEDEDENSENIKNLDDAEERYPSLEDLLDYPSRSKTTESESTKTSRGTRRPSNGATSAQMSRISSGADIAKEPYKANPQISRENTFSRQYISNHASKQNEFYSPTPQLQHQLPSQNNERGSSELEKEEGWQTHNTKINKSAERLVDDIFTTGSKTPTNSQPTENLNRANEELQKYVKENPFPSGADVLETDSRNVSASQKSKSKNTEHLENSSEKTKDPREGAPDELYLDAQEGQKEDAFQPERDAFVAPSDQNNQIKRPPYYNALAADGDIEYVKAPNLALAADTLKEKDSRDEAYDRSSGKDIRRQGNPWGSYTTKRSNSGIRDHSMSPVNEKTQGKSYDYSKKTPHELMGSLSIDTGFAKGQQIGEPIDTNDLINLQDPIPQDPLEDTSKKPPPMQGMNELAVVDLDNEKVTYEENPRFKKKTNSQPSKLNVQEEVIDFASDDENPEHSSEMNRLSIRNSLKKPKSKKGEHQRTESNSSEGKRILGFQSHRKT